MSSKKKKTKEKDERRELYNQAAEAFRQGLFPSMTACAGHFGVNHKTLIKCLESEREYVGCGRKSSTFSMEEESKLVKFVSDHLSLGCGINFSQLSHTRTGKCSPSHQLPYVSFIRIFINQNNMVVWRTVALSKAKDQNGLFLPLEISIFTRRMNWR